MARVKTADNAGGVEAQSGIDMSPEAIEQDLTQLEQLFDTDPERAYDIAYKLIKDVWAQGDPQIQQAYSETQTTFMSDFTSSVGMTTDELEEMAREAEATQITQTEGFDSSGRMKISGDLDLAEGARQTLA